MKKRASVVVVSIVVASLIVFAATGFGQGTTGKVVIGNNYIVVQPGTKLSDTDSKALDDVLAKYDKSLYKIVTYKAGQVTATVGTLSDLQIDQKASAALDVAKSAGQSDRAIQVIAPNTGFQKPIAMVPVNPQNNTLATAAAPSASASATPSATPPTVGSVRLPSSPVNPQISGNTTNPQTTLNSQQTDAVMQQLTPILDKYSQ